MASPSSPDLAPSITLSDVSYAWPDGTPVFDDLSFSVPRAAYSLVGANGAGKTTLLRLIAGELVPTSGTITTGDVALVPQHAFADATETVASALGIEAIRSAIAAIEAGSVDEAHFETVGDDWDIEARAVSELAALGLPTDLDRTVGTLSGGEATLLAIVSRVIHRPAVLLLDEPTNNLDTVSRTRLFDLIEHFPGTVLLVSHDLELLERVDSTLELYHGQVRVFGGPYSHYRETIDAEQTTAEAAVANAANDLRRQRKEMTQAQITLDRRARTAAKAEREKRVPKIISHLRRDTAEKSAGRFHNEHRDDVAAASGRLDAARDEVRADRTTRITMPSVTLPRSAQVIVDDRLRMDGPERVALTGPNGAGKSTLIGDVIDVGGVVVPFALVPQKIVFDDPEQTVVDHVSGQHPDIDAQQVRAHLARFLFRGSRADRQLGDLSGGERLRVALATALLVTPSPTLLILDEPTNNLDIDTTEELASALAEWTGALLLVSHDTGFRERVGVDREVTLR
ncbi:ABC-F family ATP-binding cassette domain-containing protein [Gordonia aichiensis]